MLILKVNIIMYKKYRLQKYENTFVAIYSQYRRTKQQERLCSLLSYLNTPMSLPIWLLLARAEASIPNW